MPGMPRIPKAVEIGAEPGALEHMLGNYEPPAGNSGFREGLAGMFRREFGWEIGPQNVGVTAGGQTAFFFLFNAGLDHAHAAAWYGQRCNRCTAGRS